MVSCSAVHPVLVRRCIGGRTPPPRTGSKGPHVDSTALPCTEEHDVDQHKEHDHQSEADGQDDDYRQIAKSRPVLRGVLDYLSVLGVRHWISHRTRISSSVSSSDTSSHDQLKKRERQ